MSDRLPKGWRRKGAWRAKMRSAMGSDNWFDVSGAPIGDGSPLRRGLLMRRRTFDRRRNLRDRLCSFFVELGQWAFQRDCQHLVHGVDEVQLHLVAKVFWDFRDIFLVLERQDDFKQARAMRGQQLFLQTADGQDFAA